MIRPGKYPPQRGQRLRVKPGKPHHLHSSGTTIWGKRGGELLKMYQSNTLEQQRQKGMDTDLRCSILGSIHLCGTLTILGKPVVPDVCSTYAKSLCPEAFSTTAVPQRSAPSAFWATLCCVSGLWAATGSSLTRIRVSLNLGNTTHTSADMCLTRAVWKRLMGKGKKINVNICTKYWTLVVLS